MQKQANVLGGLVGAWELLVFKAAQHSSAMHATNAFYLEQQIE